MRKPESFAAYAAAFPKDVQARLRQLRAAIKKAAPKATEAISYGMPTFKLYGNLVHFAGYKGHIGFYPAPSGIEAFKKELEGYPTSKGTVRFDIDEPLPLALIAKIVRFRAKENVAASRA